MRDFSISDKMLVHFNIRWTRILSKLEKSFKTREHEVIFRGNLDPCDNTIM